MLAERFFKLFDGLDRAHGIFTIAQSNGVKVGGKARTEQTPPTLELWRQHLEGTLGLGVVPIREDNTCRFGAVDIDVYPLDLAVLAREIASLKMPLVVCRTKSGGAHLYLFTREPVPAELLRGRLMEWAIALGYAGVEVFPKQVRLAGPKDIGNWINMPYLAGARSVRYAVDADGKRLSPEAFLDAAEGGAVDEEFLDNFELPLNSDEGAFQEGPPCLQSLAKRGFPPGSRNNALFDIAVYLRKRHETGWEEKLAEMNIKYMSPGKQSEVDGAIKSVKKKGYSYMCGEQPIVSCCNKQVCLTRKYGVGSGEGEPGVVFGEIVKLTTTPPTWIWDVNGARIELSTEDLMSQGRFQKHCMEQLNKWPNIMKPARWRAMIQERLGRATVVEVPTDATDGGLLTIYLQRYCTGQAQARVIDEMLMSKPFTDKEAKRTYFTSTDFMRYLEQQKVRGVGVKDLYRWIRKLPEHEHHFMNLKGKGVNCWSVPSFPEQTEPFAVPQPQKDAM